MYTTRSFMAIVEKFRKEMPGFNFTTDVIVGFPGETEENFSETERMVTDARFSHIHTFRYSRRKGTRADRLEEQIDELIKSQRAEAIRLISEKNRLLYMDEMVGKTELVLIEKIDQNGIAHGYGEHYLPVEFSTTIRTKNIFQDVLIEKVDPTEPPRLIGRI